MGEKPLRPLAGGLGEVELDQLADGLTSGVTEFVPGFRLQETAVITAVGEESAGFVIDPRQAAGHAGSEVDACGAQNHGQTSRHVFAAVVAHSFNDGEGPGVTHREALPGAAGSEKPSAGGT